MINLKRLTILSGHYGSGKTNIAVNLALEQAKLGKKVAVSDLDIVNPYFRTKDSYDLFAKNGIMLISSEYAGTNLDIPAMPQEIYSLTDDKSITGIIDVGGDDRGALALGRLVPAIKDENNYEMLMVLNMFRPLTRTTKDALEVKYEIENACGLKFTGIINNSNLGAETKAKDIIDSISFSEEFSRIASIPLKLITCEKRLENEVVSKLKSTSIPVLGMVLQKRPV
ncbi:MAG: hypothetical protein J6Y68_05190 [Clostridia bacterium]|nr:hypothetical protein [Clostridia bacterium]